MLNDQPMAVFDFWKSAEIVDDLTFPFFSSQDLLLQISSSLERLYKFPTVQSQTQSPGYGDLGSQKNLMGSCGERITQCGFGACCLQNSSDNLGAWCAKASGAHSSKGGNGTC